MYNNFTMSVRHAVVIGSLAQIEKDLGKPQDTLSLLKSPYDELYVIAGTFRRNIYKVVKNKCTNQ